MALRRLLVVAALHLLPETREQVPARPPLRRAARWTRVVAYADHRTILFRDSLELVWELV